MLAQIAALTRIDLGAGIIKVMVFDKCTELRHPIVVRACDDLPGEVRMTCASAGAEASICAGEVEPRGFGKVNADAGVGLKFSKRESPNKIRHEGDARSEQKQGLSLPRRGECVGLARLNRDLLFSGGEIQPVRFQNHGHDVRTR